MRQELLAFPGTWVHPQFLAVSVLVNVLVFCVMLCVLFAFVLFLCTQCSQFPSLSIPDCPFVILLTFIYIYKLYINKNLFFLEI